MGLRIVTWLQGLEFYHVGLRVYRGNREVRTSGQLLLMFHVCGLGGRA